MRLQSLPNAVLIVLGVGFLFANTRILLDYARFLRRRKSAVLTWPTSRSPQVALTLGLGVVLGILLFFKLFVLRQQAFGEGMMFLYYAILLPLARRIGRGFYVDGIWADSVFVPYPEIGGISWREGEHTVTLVVISRLRNLARRLNVPAEHYGAARRLLRDKIGEHAIQFAGTGLDLGVQDERDSV